MRITLLHPPHTSIGSRIPRENLPPFGLLCIGGPLIDAGHSVNLINADMGPMTSAQIITAIIDSAPEAVLIGHSGSTSAHPVVVRLATMIKAALPDVIIIYGGVWPSYHWADVLNECPAIDVIVRGEGEMTAPKLIAGLGQDLRTINGRLSARRHTLCHSARPDDPRP